MLHSSLKLKGLCAVVCISVARMFLVVEDFNTSKLGGATNRRIKVVKISVEVFSLKKCFYM